MKPAPVAPPGPHFLLWQARPVFVSSTFRDLHRDRDWLNRHAFLELNERLRARAHYLEVIDLRQGVETTALAGEGERELKVLKVCLDEILRSRPFFVGLLGDRYGWIPPPARLAAAASDAGFRRDLDGCSVTELEILYGVLENDDQRKRSWFYFRETDYTGMPAEARREVDDHFASQDPSLPPAQRAAAADRWARLRDLKARITARLPTRVRTYAVRWDSPEEGLKDLDRRVATDLWADMEEETAAFLRDAPKDSHAADRRVLDDFAAEQLRGYVERPDATRRMLDHARSTGPQRGLVVAGEAGAGKSTLFARVYADLREDRDLLLLVHAAGISPSSGQVNPMLRRWIAELAEFLGEANPEPDPSPAAAERSRSLGEATAKQEKPLDQRLEETFTALLFRAAKQTRVVLLLDALNQFEPTVRAQHLTWLPRLLPDSCRFLATAIPGTSTGAAQQRQWFTVWDLSPITRPEALEMARAYFRVHHHREANEAALAVLLDRTRPDGQACHGNALWLALALQELNLLEADDYERADREFSSLPPDARLQALLVQEATGLAPDVPGVYAGLLDRAEKDHGQAWVRAVTDAIALSRSGWRESDLRALVPALTGLPWQDLTFAGLRRTLGRHLVQRGADARWDTFHVQLRQAVLARDLGEESRRKELHGKLADHLLGLPPDDSLRIGETMVHLLGLGDPDRAAIYLANNVLFQFIHSMRPDLAGAGLENIVHLLFISFMRSALAGAVSVLVEAIQAAASEADCTRLVQWIADLMTGEDNTRCGRLAHLVIFNLHDALQVTGASLTELSRLQLLESASRTLQRLHEANPHDAQVARDLAVTLYKLGDFYLRRRDRGDTGRALDSYRHSLQINQLLHEANPNDAEAARDLSYSQGRLGNFYFQHRDSGGAGCALEAYQRCLQIAQRMHESNPHDAQAARDLSVSFYRLGDFYLRRGERGDEGRTLEAYQRSLQIAQRLHETTPHDAQARRDLSYSQGRLGDFYLKRWESGDAGRALEAYHRCHETLQHLHEANPHDAQAARDLSVSLNKLGDFYLKRWESGDSGRALKAYHRCHEILQRLHEANPNDAQAALELSAVQVDLGNFYLRRGESGDAGRALEAYQRSLDTRQRLHDANPKDAQVARDLSETLSNLGDFYQRRGERGDAGRALESYQRSLETRQHLHEGNLNDAKAARDLSVSQERLAAFYLRRGESGDAGRALENYQRCHETLQRLHDANPNDAQAASDLSSVQMQLGDFYLRRGQSGDVGRALEAYQRSLELGKRLHEANPHDAQEARGLSVSLIKLGDFFLRRGESGDTGRALDAYQHCHETLQRLHEANPNDSQAARDLAGSIQRLGEVARAAGDQEGFWRYLRQSFALLDGMHQRGQYMDKNLSLVYAQQSEMLAQLGPEGRAYSTGPGQDSGVQVRFAGQEASVAPSQRKLAPVTHEPLQGPPNRALAHLKAGRIQDALDGLRPLVFLANGLVMNEDAPMALRLNFVLALLRQGNISGAETYLPDLVRSGDPRAGELRAALDAWKKNLGWAEKLGLKAKRPIALAVDAYD